MLCGPNPSASAYSWSDTGPASLTPGRCAVSPRRERTVRVAGLLVSVTTTSSGWSGLLQSPRAVCVWSDPMRTTLQ